MSYTTDPHSLSTACRPPAVIRHVQLAAAVLRSFAGEWQSTASFSKRLRETLSLLLEGLSEKQVASSLNLGTRTVHDYVARLYEHFRVSSRAELLAYFIRRRPVPRNQPTLAEAMERQSIG